MTTSRIATPLTPLPHLSTKQMIEVDRLMIEKYHMTLLQMMENAGRGLAILAREKFLQGHVLGKRIVVLAGTGGNGGGGLVFARRMAAWGAQVEVYLATPAMRMRDVPRQQLHIVQQMGLPVMLGGDVPSPGQQPFDLVVDALIGYSLKGDPHGTHARLIEWANQCPSPTLSLDTPSGLDLTNGTIHNPTVKADATLTLALPKQGLFVDEVLPIRGDLYLADIGVPPQLYSEPGLGLMVGPIFAEADILQL